MIYLTSRNWMTLKTVRTRTILLGQALSRSAQRLHAWRVAAS